MESNGFGSFVQKIVIRPLAGDAEALARKLDAIVQQDSNDKSKSLIIWKRTTTRLRDDEDVVRELFVLAGSRDWEIDWRASRY